MENNYEYLIEHVDPDEFSRWEEVDLEVYAFTDLGIKVAINDKYTGLVYGNQVYEQYHEGQKLKGYISAVREDGRIDVSLQPDKGRHVHSDFRQNPESPQGSWREIRIWRQKLSRGYKKGISSEQKSI